MKRLTKRYASHIAVVCDNCEEKGSYCDTSVCCDVMRNRLAEYEDTGLEPKEINEKMNEAYDLGAQSVLRYKGLTWREAEELLRYREAEEQGLLARLPCKLGEKVYWIMECSCANIDGVYSKCEYCGYEPDYEVDCEICNRPEGTKCPHQYRISEGRAKEQNILMIARNLGKTVFLTREAAEKALEDA